MNKDKKAIKQLAQNRKAYHDYFVLDKYEAGIELFGTEVKSLRLGQANLTELLHHGRQTDMGQRASHQPLRKRQHLQQRPSASASVADAQKRNTETF